jgi:hypothetical protein
MYNFFLKLKKEFEIMSEGDLHNILGIEII